MDKKPVNISGLHKKDTLSGSKVCVFCGRLASADCCGDCRETARKQIEIIAEYLKYHPGSSTIDICNNTDIPYHHVRGLFEIGWLAIIEEEEKKP